MKPWLDLKSVPIPTRIQHLDKDARGYPIPFSVGIGADGKPDFRVIDPAKWMRAAQHRLCGICGRPLGAHLAFVGGTLSIANRLFTDLPMHHGCAVYGLRTCPFLAAPKFAYSRTIPEGATVSRNVDETRPKRFGLGITRGYQLGRLPDGEVVIKADAFGSVEWWHQGSPIVSDRLEQLQMHEALERYDTGELQVFAGPRSPFTVRDGVRHPGEHRYWYIGFLHSQGEVEGDPMPCHELPTFPTKLAADEYLNRIRTLKI